MPDARRPWHVPVWASRRPFSPSTSTSSPKCPATPLSRTPSALHQDPPHRGGHRGTALSRAARTARLFAQRRRSCPADATRPTHTLHALAAHPGRAVEMTEQANLPNRKNGGFASSLKSAYPNHALPTSHRPGCYTLLKSNPKRTFLPLPLSHSLQALPSCGKDSLSRRGSLWAGSHCR
jgi:hypothetical protein